MSRRRFGSAPRAIHSQGSPPSPPRRGSAAVELALLLPVVLLLMAGIMEFAWMFHQHGVMELAVRHGCREGAVDPSTGDAEATAVDAMLEYMEHMGFRCDAVRGCSSTVTLAAAGDDMVLECRVSTPPRSLTGLLPRIDSMTLATATHTRLEWGD